MILKEIKAKCILKDITMTELSELLGIDRRLMYYRIKANNEDTISKIKKILL